MLNMTIPEYFKAYVDKSVDLTVTKNIPCPFHNEKEGKSFTYSPEKQIWRCWGACHTGGDVIKLHQLNYHLKSYQDAKVSLYKLLGIQEELKPSFQKPKVRINPVDNERRVLYSMANRIASEGDYHTWLELDYIMSKVPYNTDELKTFIMKHGGTLDARSTQ